MLGFGAATLRRYVVCDDGSTYVFERSEDSRQWRARMRVDADGTRTFEPARLPAAVDAHMTGVTRSGPEGCDGPHYLE